jgi:hypothetical protein
MQWEDDAITHDTLHMCDDSTGHEAFIILDNVISHYGTNVLSICKKKNVA